MGALIPPTISDQGSFPEAAAQIHRILTRGAGTEHARVRQVGVYLEQLCGAYFTAGKTEGAVAELAQLAAERDAYKKAKEENDERFMIERETARQGWEASKEELARLQELVKELTGSLAKARTEADAWKACASQEVKQHQRTTQERDMLVAERRSQRPQVPASGRSPDAITRHVPESVQMPAPGDVNRCGACGWPLVTEGKGCMRGDCSQRPLPVVFYDQARYKAEVLALAEKQGTWVSGSESTSTEPLDTPRAPGEPPQQDGRST